MLTLLWITANAHAATPVHLCDLVPCTLGLLSADHNIVPPDVLRTAAAEVSPEPLKWIEFTLTMYRGTTVQLTVDGVRLDPRAGIQDTRAGTTTWMIPVRSMNGIAFDVYNPSRTTEAEYDIDGLVYIEHH
jgi:hypothetical protein